MSNLILFPGQQNTAVLSCPKAFQSISVGIPLPIRESNTVAELSSLKKVRIKHSTLILEPWGLELITVTKY